MIDSTEIISIEQLMELGNRCVRQSKNQKALLYFNSVVLSAPEHIEALTACAETLINLNRAAEASIYSRRALQLCFSLNILSLHAKVLYEMGEYVHALECFERVCFEQPSNYKALSLRALCLTKFNRYDEALEVYQKALVYSPVDDPWTRYHYSLCLLTMGNLCLGFEMFEYRWKSILSTKSRTWVFPESTPINRLLGKSILIYFEQSINDSIQFFRYIPLLVQSGAHVVIEIEATLIPLFSSWRNTVRFIAMGSSLPFCDFYCSSISLARFFKTEIETIPKSIPYIFPNTTAFDACQRKFDDTAHQRIGIAWKGNSMKAMNQNRNIDLNTLLTLHAMNMDFICLQKNIDLNEKKLLEQHQIVYHGLELGTLEGTAALIACLDLIITVDTFIAHLAAAMGKEVWILLPFSADWRWFLNRDDSPWYPNVKLFRQKSPGDWRVPLCRIKELLKSSTIKHQTRTKELIAQANLQNQKGLFNEAAQLYREILINDPKCHAASQSIALAALQQHNMADAIQYMQQAAEIAPHISLYKRNLGELLRRVGQLEASINAHQNVISQEPASAENHYLLALSYYDSHQFKLAIQHYRVAISLDNSHGLAWNNLGASLEAVGQKQQAKIAYNEAIQLNPNHTEAQNNLGVIYSEEGLIDKASQCFEAAITANPDFTEAHYNLSLIKTYKTDDPHLALLETRMQKINQYSIRARIHYYFALGKALDDTQQYARAMQAYAEGNRLHYLEYPWDKETLQNHVKQLPTVFTQAFFKKTKRITEAQNPIFIVGMPRAGTTLIEQILASHKNIYGAGELCVLDNIIQEALLKARLPFHTWVTQLTDDEFTALGKKYLEKTAILAPDKAFIIDKMPSNCFYVGMIYRMLPSAKIIHAIRDPMDSCFSCFTHLFKTSMLFAYDLKALGEYYALYAQAMQHWQAVLPPNTMFDLPYEQMIANHEALSKQLIEYIGLPWDPNCLNFYKNDRIVKTASLTQVRKPIYKTSVQRWQYFAETLQPLLHSVAPYRNQKGISA